MPLSPEQQAKHFIENETAFRLGILPTENPHPKTENLSRIIAKETAAGVANLFEVDQDITLIVPRVIETDHFDRLVAAMVQSVLSRRHIFFTGCGATGRLAILLEATWRRFWEPLLEAKPELNCAFPNILDTVIGLMAGGDHALIRSVEGFEDSLELGRFQIAEAGLGFGDTVVAVTEGGETSFVIGTAWQGVDARAATFFVYNNPTDILRENIERSRAIIDSPAVTTLDLFTGPMAITGSTRMQATTAELLILGAAIEKALHELLCHHLTDEELAEWHLADRSAADYADGFSTLLDEISSKKNIETIAQLVEWEEKIYKKDGILTYMADVCLLDILTDTTERAPTFRLPPFRKCDDTTSEPSWAFVKHPCFPTPEAWHDILRRKPRGLDWPQKVYHDLGVPESIYQNVPSLNTEELIKYQIGNEPDPTLLLGTQGDANSDPESGLAMLLTADEMVVRSEHRTKFNTVFAEFAKEYRQTATICVGAISESQQGPEEHGPKEDGDGSEGDVLGQDIPSLCQTENCFHIVCDLNHSKRSPIRLWDRLAVKLVLNLMSTATMTRLNRVEGNLMVHVASSNKKLIDRSTRQVMRLAKVDYETACIAIHRAMHAVDKLCRDVEGAISPVTLAVKELKEKKS